MFENYQYDDYVRDFHETKEIRFLEPMTAKEFKDKLEDVNDVYLAEEKLDGHRATCYITSKGNRFFSRRISKKTGWYAENTDCLPHLRDLDRKGLEGTILDGELTMPTGVFADVQGVTGALPEKAIQNQKEKGWAVFNAFDILYYKGKNIQAFPLWKRKIYLFKVICELACANIVFHPVYVVGALFSDNFKLFNSTVVSNYKVLLDEVWGRGGEGLILKDINARYEQKRSKSFLKVKDCIYRDVVVMGYDEPTRDFDGKTELEDWQFWIEEDPVTKPYYYGWVGAIRCGVYKDGELIEVVSLKGFTDDEQWHIRENREKLLGTVLEVKAHQVSDKELGTLRHPRFSRWRPDKTADMCQWEEHVQ